MTTQQHDWIALLLFEFTGVSAGQYREDVAIIRAASEETALQSAIEHGRQQEGSSLNEAGEETGLRFLGVADLTHTLYDEPAKGEVWDLYARHFDDLEAFKAFDPYAAKVLTDEQHRPTPR